MIPTRKVGAGALAGALAVIVIYVLNTVAQIELPPEVASAITVVITFVTSYFVPEG